MRFRSSAAGGLRAWGVVLALLLASVLARAPSTQAGFSAATQPPTGNPISLEEYQSRIAQALAAIEQAADVTEAERVQAGQALLADIGAVQLPSGETVEIAPLLSGQESLEDAIQRLRVVQSQLAAAGRDDAAHRLALLRTILARPEFTPQLSLWERIQQWLGDLLQKLFPNLGEITSPVPGRVGEVLVWLLAGAGGLLIVFLLSYWLAGLLRSFVADAEARRRAESGETEPLTTHSARQQATDLALAGNYRQAVRLLYLSLLLQMEERGFLRYDRSLTNREVVAQVTPAAPAVGAGLQPVVQTFDAVWYGLREPDSETYQHYEQDVDRLRGTLETAQEPPPEVAAPRSGAHG